MSKIGPIVAWGEVLWDRFPGGDVLGGAPSNVAYHLAALGAAVDLATRVGDDEDGRRARRELETAGVGTALVQVDSERATGEVGICIDASGDAIYTLHADRAWERIECGEPERRRLAAAAAIVYGTLAQRSADGRRGHADALRALPDDAERVCDPNLRSGFAAWDVLRDSLSSATIVKINENEAAAIEDKLGAANAVEWLHRECGASLVALTRGPRGAVLSSGGERVEFAGIGAPPGGDNVGCGDAFVAVLTLAGLTGAPLQDAAEAACRYASFVAGQRGATPTMPAALVAATRTALTLDDRAS